MRSSSRGSWSAEASAASRWARASSSAVSAVSNALTAGSIIAGACVVRRSSRRTAAASVGTGDCAPATASWASRRSPATFSTCIMAVRRSASVVSSDGSGLSLRNSSTAWRSQSASRCARSTSARCVASSSSRVRRSFHSLASAAASLSRSPKASSSRRWVAASTSARSSCWPWISTSATPSVRSACTLTGWSLTKARVRPSANCVRRRISSSSAWMPLSAASARTGWSAGSSKAAVTCPCSAPWRTSAASPRAPSASAKASSRIDLPAPVSPVSTARPSAKSMSSRSIRTMSRIESRVSMTVPFHDPGRGRAPLLADSPSSKTTKAGTRPGYCKSAHTKPRIACVI